MTLQKNKYFLFWTVCFLLLLITGFIFFQRYIDLYQEKNNTPDYFISIPIEGFSSSKIPYVNIELENQIVSTVLDLGFRGDISLSATMIDQLKNKRFSHMGECYGFKGHQYQPTVYSIPTVHISNLTISNVLAEENPLSFVKDAVLTPLDSNQLTEIQPTIGWCFFRNTNLLLYFQNNHMTAYSTLEQVEKAGYKIAQYAQTPLLLDRGLIECMVKTPEGSLRCVLDTGCTLNLINIKNDSYDLQNQTTFSDIQIGSDHFKDITFYHVPINVPIHIDAILGMNFFLEHVVIIDFASKTLYFSKTLK